MNLSNVSFVMIDDDTSVVIGRADIHSKFLRVKHVRARARARACNARPRCMYSYMYVYMYICIHARADLSICSFSLFLFSFDVAREKYLVASNNRGVSVPVNNISLRDMNQRLCCVVYRVVMKETQWHERNCIARVEYVNYD